MGVAERGIAEYLEAVREAERLEKAYSAYLKSKEPPTTHPMEQVVYDLLKPPDGGSKENKDKTEGGSSGQAEN